ncbi:MAG: response regulator, partial [Desulfobacterales bacterium]|nr:response regulator [Desulfobacterales bacterium]
MIKNVLLVDDDTEMLHALKEGFKKYQESFAVLLAEDGLQALKGLKQNIISLVVTDLKMPNMDGFELLAHIMEHYPDIPVIIITGYSTPEMEQLARKGGAVGYIAKPFLIENLARQILTTLRKESEGGTLHNVSSGMFLQLIEMEQKTCTIRLEEKSGGEKGILFFSDGELLDARVNHMQGESAAHEIFSWDAVNLSIQNGCALKENKIQSDLQPLILEAMRRKDEEEPEEVPESVMEQIEPSGEEPADRLKRLKLRIEQEIGPQCGLEDLYQDEFWDSRVAQLSKAGEFFH